MTDDLVQRLRAIRERHEKSFKGKWRVARDDWSGYRVSVKPKDGVGEYVIADRIDQPRSGNGQRDARFIAHAHDDIPFLLDRIEALEAEARDLQHDIGWLTSIAVSLEAEVGRMREALYRETRECFTGNIEAVSKLDLDAFEAQPILMAVQSWDISTGRARELLRCWVLGSFTPDMLPPCKGLDIGEDDDPAELLAEARREIENLRDMMGAALSGKEPPR